MRNIANIILMLLFGMALIACQAQGENIKKVESSTITTLQNGDTLELSADKVLKEIQGSELLMYGYNGQIPGPAIRVEQNSSITVKFTNNLDMPTTVHWHGLRHDINFDGVPGVSQDPINPGETFTYQLYFPDDGIYWYHPHIREDIQQELGLSGNIHVLPLHKYNPVNREEILLIDDILLENGKVVPFGEEHANFAVMGRFGNVMLVNGEENYELQVKKGEIVRFYFTNVANARPFNISIPGAVMKLVGGDMGQYEYEEYVGNIILAPAQRAFVDVLFEKEGDYFLEHVNPHKTYVLGRIVVEENGIENSFAKEFHEDRVNQEVITDISKFEKYFDNPIDYEINLGIEMRGMPMGMMPCHQMPDGSFMGNCGEEHITPIEWEDEMRMRTPGEMVDWILEDANTGKKNEEIMIKAKVGDIVKMRFFNDPNSMHPMQHPIHLHGQRFVVTHIDGKAVENKVWSDTVLVPVGATVDILVDVTNPGEWMLHCHIAEHLETGMMSMFMVEE